MKNFGFPQNFLWGAAASSHQVEGGNHNDWSEWEQSESRLKNLESRIKPPDAIQNYISGRASDHYNRYQEDFDIARSLGHNAHRFSLEWSRIEPEEGKFEEKEIEHYREVLRALRARGLEPFVTIWHGTLPIWLRDKGGVAAKEFPDFFKRYAERVAESLGTQVHFWITVNEPEIYALNCYLRGKWPPKHKSVFDYCRVLQHLIRAHALAYDAIHRLHPRAEVGASMNLSYFEAGPGLLNRILKNCIEWWWNYHFLRNTRKKADFIGLNYYFHNRIYYGFNKNANAVISDMGWEVYPEGLYYVLLSLKRFGKPVYITENGIADAKDEKRADFIRQSLQNVSRALGEGADVRGYLYWSLLDNFEWDSGFGPRFGLVEVDYRTLERKIRNSAYVYKDMIGASKT